MTYVWRTKVVAFDKKNTLPTVKHGRSLVVVGVVWKKVAQETLHMEMEEWIPVNVILEVNVTQLVKKLKLNRN